ncbi:MAG: tRNA (adenosine(37)-N6)-threonylcarbamoyltransferase complex ATPase subunit type 1 TsaE [Candidatus Marinimicrobia bacterium]|nr:tRNA (adenosine(37)-N6)-threonylcarbamoyltransferase complex ATPase subunit type 1 TsaE [Candidatus Neomarinimicrobiota bacterium]
MKSGWVGGKTNSAEATLKSGEHFADFLEKGDVFAFIGELASGKTTFIKGILKGLDYNKSVTSPTFTLVNEYDAKYPIIHIDCYREDELERWIKLGLNDYFSEENIVIIEWADKMKSLLPENTIKVNFSHKSLNSREIILITP